jgi:hypothetical protein
VVHVRVGEAGFCMLSSPCIMQGWTCQRSLRYQYIDASSTQVHSSRLGAIKITESLFLMLNEYKLTCMSGSEMLGNRVRAGCGRDGTRGQFEAK